MNTEEEIKKLKEEIKDLSDLAKKNFDYIFECGLFDKAAMAAYEAGNRSSDGGGGAAEEITSDDLYEVVSFEVKKKPNDGGIQPYAWKLKVKNTSDRKLTLSASIIAQDSDEFNVDESPVAPFEIKAGSTATETGIVNIFEEHKVAQIKNWTCTFHVY
jgi:hypothetical protein